MEDNSKRVTRMDISMEDRILKYLEQWEKEHLPNIHEQFQNIQNHLDRLRLPHEEEEYPPNDKTNQESNVDSDE